MITYLPDFTGGGPDVLQVLLDTIPWADCTANRRECFMVDGGGLSYTYGSGRGARQSAACDLAPLVRSMMARVNDALATLGHGALNTCFANCYATEGHHLGWHADNFDGMDHTRPVVSVSFGEAREFWWRPNGERGETPPERRQRLASGSLLLMPPGMQRTHEHKVPKGAQPMGPRVSLTFRRFTGVA